MSQSAMSRQTDREIRWLKTLADYRRCYRRPPRDLRDPEYKKRMEQKVPHDAGTITSLVMNASLAATLDESSTYVRRFVLSYRRNRNLDLNKLAHEDIVYILKETCERLDEMFFFDLLTRRVRDKSPGPKVVLVELNVHESPMNGKYDETFSFPDLLHTLAHEMVHAYLAIFSDKEHPLYHDECDHHNGHGMKFWELLAFILGKIGFFTESEAMFKCIQDVKMDFQAAYKGYCIDLD
ncbi:hypothetical protein HD806DRAFT_171266 [Xylariaceae sp. AK1471]|nr:hypothetical protein HD806DRAFT_171266 [Xylariaceae sp. AK1471]